jgi:hypothetical protein
MKALSKSRFKLGLECPNKVYFSNNKDIFYNSKNEDPFLKALASGGFQVEEYARLQYPEGKLIDAPYKDDNYQFFHEETKKLLKNENVTIFEAGFLYQSLFIRTDIMVKKGNEIKLIEVKAKSYDPKEEHSFTTKTGKIVSSWKPYLFDLAFQTYVTQKSYPNCKVTPYLYLVDKTKSATIEGLNQMFRVKKESDKRTGVEVLANAGSDLGENLMGLINHSEIVQKIINDEFKYYDNLGFQEAINLLRSVRLENKYPNWPTSFSACKKCEFKLDSGASKNNISGFEYCFQKQHNWKSTEFKKPNIFNIWDFKNTTVFEQGKYFKEDLNEDDIKLKPVANKISRTERQWLQVEKERDKDFTEYFDKEGFLNESSNWNYPFHFIDFETSTVPLPFHKGRTAYEQIAFQFSHHILYEDGKIEHASEYINTSPGEFPNFIFMQHLHDALVHDNGTIFKYATHENTILNAIRKQLLASNYSFKDELIQFIESISHPTDNTVNKWEVPPRDMVDLCQIIKNFYYHPKTYGSNSIKKVLPAILETSNFVRSKYSKPIGNINVSSKNFSSRHVWLSLENGTVVSPYSMLPSVHEDMTHEEIETSLSQIENIEDGGAALTAYGKIQYTDMTKEEREKIGSALKRYCELDTLAMVMIYEHLNSIS